MAAARATRTARIEPRKSSSATASIPPEIFRARAGSMSERIAARGVLGEVPMPVRRLAAALIVFAAIVGLGCALAGGLVKEDPGRDAHVQRRDPPDHRDLHLVVAASF